MMASSETSPKVLLFPFLAYGHLGPTFELAKNLSKNNFLVYFCSTPVNLKFYAKKLDDHSIKQVEFHLQSTPELPPHYHTTKGLPFHLHDTLAYAVDSSGPVFSTILENIQPDLVIYDIYQTWLPPLAASYGIPAVAFSVTGAVTLCHYLHPLKHPNVEFPFTPVNSFRSRLEDKGPEHKRIILGFTDQSTDLILVKSSRAFEDKYIDYHSSLSNKKTVPIGMFPNEPADDSGADSEIIQWLDGKEEASTVYIAFGSQLSLTKEEMKEIALGLEISNVNFVWVVSIPKGSETTLEDLMPEGFLDRTKGRGFIEEKWAPQTKILKHPSIGAFLSHCGWGSLAESITFGVPIVGMPWIIDQPFHSKLVEEVGVGLEVVEEENGERKGEEIARTIKKVMFTDEGKAIREKCREVGRKIKEIFEEEVDAMVQELRGLCEKKKKNLLSLTVQ